MPTFQFFLNGQKAGARARVDMARARVRTDQMGLGPGQRGLGPE